MLAQVSIDWLMHFIIQMLSHEMKDNHHVDIYLGNLVNLKKKKSGASLVAQWLRICLLMQGTRVRALVWEDPTCHGAAGPVSHNC